MLLFISIFSFFIGCFSDTGKSDQTSKTSQNNSQKTNQQGKKHDPHASTRHTKGNPNNMHNKGKNAQAEEKVIEVGPIPDNAKVWFIEPKDGATVSSPVTIKMGVEGMEIEPVTNGLNEGKGHHHVIVNHEPTKKGHVIPMDEKHNHFGKGQTETELTLPPGEHTLHLQLANGAHVSYGEKLRSSIKITVK